MHSPAQLIDVRGMNPFGDGSPIYTLKKPDLCAEMFHQQRITHLCSTIFMARQNQVNHDQISRLQCTGRTTVPAAGVNEVEVHYALEGYVGSEKNLVWVSLVGRVGGYPGPAAFFPCSFIEHHLL